MDSWKGAGVGGEIESATDFTDPTDRNKIFNTGVTEEHGVDQYSVDQFKINFYFDWFIRENPRNPWLIF